MTDKAKILFFTAAVLAASSARASAPAGRYSVAPGIVTDTKTGLAWQQQYMTGLTQQAAVSYCAAQGSAWRLPTVKDLFTLYDLSYSGSGPGSGAVFLDTNAFGSVAYFDAFFWSSTVFAADPNNTAWEVFFGEWVFNVTTSPISSGYTASARCVR